MDQGERKGKLLDSIFPPRYDFHAMLQAQAESTKTGVQALVEWLHRNDLSVAPDALLEIEQKADDARHVMEGQLLTAFSTPFDRQDIYSISRQMDYILNYSLSTAQEMRAFNVMPDEAVVSMAEALLEGTTMAVDAIKIMGKDPAKADRMVADMRRSEREIEAIYIGSMSLVFQEESPIDAMKKREIYHHMKDAGRTLSITIDILHRIIVGLA